MKNVFDINFKSRHYDGAALRIRELSPALQKEQDALHNRMCAAVFNEPPVLYRILRGVCPLLALILAVLGIKELALQNYATGTTFFSLVAVSLGAFVTGLIVGNRKKLTEEEQEAKINDLQAQIAALMRRAKSDMRVPDDAAAVDMLSRIYSPYTRDEKSAFFCNGTGCVFLENDALCFSDGEAVYAMPLTEITAVARINTPIVMDAWTKETPHTDPLFADYGIVLEEDCEHYALPCYCAVRCNHKGEDYQVLLPAYDIEPVLRLTGLTLTDEE
jgi:hypothetical protein